MALACLVAGDRHHHLASEVLPVLRAGKVVICDRYLPSSLVLQCIDGIDQDNLGAPTLAGDLGSDLFERLARAAGEEDRGALGREGPGDGSTDAAPATVDGATGRCDQTRPGESCEIRRPHR